MAVSTSLGFVSGSALFGQPPCSLVNSACSTALHDTPGVPGVAHRACMKCKSFDGRLQYNVVFLFRSPFGLEPAKLRLNSILLYTTHSLTSEGQCLAPIRLIQQQRYSGD